MKVLVNGGLNLSELNGWWGEAYSLEVGWAIGDGQEHQEDDTAWNAVEAEQLYGLLENPIVPSFYDGTILVFLRRGLRKCAGVWLA
jgi:starch phosphorylase